MIKGKMNSPETCRTGIFRNRTNGGMRFFVIAMILTILLASQAFLPAAHAAGTAAQEAADRIKGKSLDEQIDFLKLLIKAANDLYYEDVDIQDLIEGAYKGVFDKLDPYSVYYTDSEYEDFDAEVTGTFGGIGVQIALRDGFITVIAPLDGTPAHKAGIKTGDRVITVDDTDVRDVSIDKVANMMRGKPGTDVKIGVLRDGKPSIIEFELTRGIIEVNPVSYEILEDNIGYIRLSEFNEHAAEHVDEALEHFDGQGIRDVVLDLRNNPGGIIGQCVDVAGKFMLRGPVVHIARRDAKWETLQSGTEEQKYNLAVLVNGGSASASEIVAGAVQDTSAGIIVGTKTFGKGTVQQLLPLKDSNGFLKLTIARYMTPWGRDIDGEGITPDVIVEELSPRGKYDDDELASIKGDRKLSTGMVGLDVLGAQQRLDTMGYEIGDGDGVFDWTLEQAIRKFQSDTGLYPYGKLDFTTQERLLTEYEIYLEESVPDVQLTKAIEVLKSLCAEGR